MNPNLFAMIAVVLAGGATALQAPTNAKMMGAVGSPVNAATGDRRVGGDEEPSSASPDELPSSAPPPPEAESASKERNATKMSAHVRAKGVTTRLPRTWGAQRPAGRLS